MANELKPEQVPEAASKSVRDLFAPGYLESIGLHPESIVAAALNAWPDSIRMPVELILPLPQQENSDE